MTTIRLVGLGKVYPGGHRAVGGVDLAIDDGEFFVLVGPSGCGKTSVLRMVAGLEEISEGRIEADGVSVDDVETERRDLAMIFQTSALYPHMTVRENLGFPLKMAKVGHREIERQVVALAEQLAISELLDARPSQLSGGQRQRVAMGRAIIRRPRLLLMDEPMSNLDAKLRTDLRSELAFMHRRLGVTTLYVTHDQVEAMSLGDRVAVMRDGRIAQCASPSELYARPADLFVAQFFGTPPMNVVRGRILADEDGYALGIGPQRATLGDEADRWPTLGDVVDGDVAVGIRPEALRPAGRGELAVEITSVEHVGGAQIVRAALDASAVTTAADGGTAIADAPVTTVTMAMAAEVTVDLWRPVRLAIDPAGLHLFDLLTGASLEPAGAPRPVARSH